MKKNSLAPIAAKNTIAAIKAEMRSLSDMTGRVHLPPEEPWHDQSVHRTRIKNYHIYFGIDKSNKKVQVIGMIHVRRDQSKQLEQMEIE